MAKSPTCPLHPKPCPHQVPGCQFPCHLSVENSHSKSLLFAWMRNSVCHSHANVPIAHRKLPYPESSSFNSVLSMVIGSLPGKDPSQLYLQNICITGYSTTPDPSWSRFPTGALVCSEWVSSIKHSKGSRSHEGNFPDYPATS